MSFPNRLLFYLFVIESSSSRPMGCPGCGTVLLWSRPTISHPQRQGWVPPPHPPVPLSCPGGKGGRQWMPRRPVQQYLGMVTVQPQMSCAPRGKQFWPRRAASSNLGLRMRAPWLPWQRRDVVPKRGLMGSVVLDSRLSLNFQDARLWWGSSCIWNQNLKVLGFFFFRFVLISTGCQLYARGLCSLVFNFCPLSIAMIWE